MKKKLEAELISIAHRILKLKNKSDLVQLHLETQKLYEKLCVLRFVEENFAEVKPTIGYTEIEDRLAVVFDAPVPTEETAIETPKEQAPEVETAKEEAAAEIPSETIAEATETVAQEAPQSAEPVAESPSKVPSSVSEQIEKSGKAIADLIKGIRGGTPQKEEEAPKSAITTNESEVEPVAELEVPEEIVAPVEAVATAQAEEAAVESSSDAVAENQDTSGEEEPKSQDDLFKPAFEWSFDAKQGEAEPSAPKSEAPKMTPAQISFDDLLGQSYRDPIFVKPEDLKSERETLKPAEKADVIPISRNFNDTANVISINKSETLNDRISKGITIGLNDRIAFMNHLFNNSSEDYNRVLSQLITLDTLSEAKNFIASMVKPDYNNWVGKEEYEQRFMEIIEKKFS